MTLIPNKYIQAAYRLYDVTDGNQELIEETSETRKFDFVSGIGFLLEAFEKQLSPLAKGDTFDFVLQPEEAYGEYVEERVMSLDKRMFMVNGRFDDQNVFVDAIIPLQNEDGNRFNGHVLEITDDHVRVDLNHPLAGRTLRFEGEILESHEASNDEISDYLTLMTGNGSSCGCSSGSCGCSADDDTQDSCGCSTEGKGHGSCGCGGGHKHQGEGCGCSTEGEEHGSCGCGGGGHKHHGEGCGCSAEGEGHGSCGCGGGGHKHHGEGCGCSTEGEGHGSCGCGGGGHKHQGEGCGCSTEGEGHGSCGCKG